MSISIHDFRSDTVTRPGKGMRDAMMAAPLGDDVFGDDPTVNRLQAVVAERLGKEAGLFLPSGTQSNLAGLMAHCGRGDEYLVGQMAHCYRWEAGGAAVLGSIQPQPITNQPDGSLSLNDIKANIKPDDSHHAITKLLALENTIGGQILDSEYVATATGLARSHGLACHLDGARAFNAAVGTGKDIADIAQPFDSVSICLSKGLGTPVGSVLVGGKDLIARAKRIRKMLGGGMRQAGLLAAAGLYALEHNVDRLAEDHANAAALAEGLMQHRSLSVTAPQTNIVMVSAEEALLDKLTAHLAARNIATVGVYGNQRWVTHLDVDETSVKAAITAVDEFFA